MQIPLKIINCENLTLKHKVQELIDYITRTSDLPTLEVDNSQGVIIWEKFKSNFYPIAKRPNLYIIYHRVSEEREWKPRYIGQRKSRGILQRLNNHLNKCSKNTGSKRQFIFNAITNNELISLKLIKVQPETLRGYFEEELINHFKNDLIWNIQS